jgi:xanthine dehydrogenase YagS FAD-binding subunit
MLYELPDFDHVDARSIAEAVEWLAEYGARAKIVAGGTELLGLMKDGITGPKMPMPELLVNIKTIPGLDTIECEDGAGARIGSAATLYEIESHPGLARKFPVLVQAAKSVATTAIRYVGTIGGNLCQRPWCWYFRHPQFVCFKRGGRQCYAIPGHNSTYFAVTNLGICVMSHPSDVAPALIASDARIVVQGREGERMIPAGSFFRGSRSVEETVLAQDELISRIEIPEPRPGTSSVYLKNRPRGTWDFALSAVAVSLTGSGRRCSDARVVLGGVAPFPYRVTSVEDILRGRVIDHALIQVAADDAVSKARPLSMNGYKIMLTKTLVRRALTEAAGQTTSVAEAVDEH